ncbi:DUF4124 domain-containing protein [Polaromonas sp. CT11-55]|uniref:DUF4124 domain-containing protein n=1 Tax=Polaromonas sp. CT11-55 TaxID=3243045 RepID=UPI0039A466AB
MKNSNLKLWIWGALLVPLLFVPSSHAQVYKWVDAKGQTHYSANKDDAGAARTDVVKLPTQPAQAPIAKPSTEYLRESSKQSQSSSPESGVDTSLPPKPPRSLSGGKEDGTDASRCVLARDVLSGAVRHSNGKPTDKYDLEVAQNDVRAFCRQR